MSAFQIQNKTNRNRVSAPNTEERAHIGVGNVTPKNPEATVPPAHENGKGYTLATQTQGGSRTTQKMLNINAVFTGGVPPLSVVRISQRASG